MNGVILLVAVQCVTAQAVAPREYPHGREPYYYYSDNSAWYDSYGRLRYGPQGIPADEYSARQKARSYQESAPASPPSGGPVVVYKVPRRGTPAPMPTAARSGVPWGRMFWPGGIPPTEAHKGLLDWH
jgi:hypothetical protein